MGINKWSLYRYYMKLLQQLLFFILFILFSTLISSPVKAAIPYELEFVIIFDYDDTPIDGRTDVVFELYNSDERKYFEIIRNVDFDQGVATVVVGGEDSDLVNEYPDIYYYPDLAEEMMSVLSTLLSHLLQSRTL